MLRHFDHMFISLSKLLRVLEDTFHGVLFGTGVRLAVGPGLGEELPRPSGVAEEDYAGVEVATTHDISTQSEAKRAKSWGKEKIKLE